MRLRSFSKAYKVANSILELLTEDESDLAIFASILNVQTIVIGLNTSNESYNPIIWTYVFRRVFEPHLSIFIAISLRHDEKASHVDTHHSLVHSLCAVGGRVR